MFILEKIVCESDDGYDIKRACVVSKSRQSIERYLDNILLENSKQITEYNNTRNEHQQKLLSWLYNNEHKIKFRKNHKCPTLRDKSNKANAFEFLSRNYFFLIEIIGVCDAPKPPNLQYIEHLYSDDFIITEIEEIE